jgi:hypothetical protein
LKQGREPDDSGSLLHFGRDGAVNRRSIDHPQ